MYDTNKMVVDEAEAIIAEKNNRATKVGTDIAKKNKANKSKTYMNDFDIPLLPIQHTEGA